MGNLLSEVHPELVAEWSDKNLPLTPDRITYGSNKVVWWKGACGHEWQTSVKARSNGENCPICSGARVVTGINDLSTLKPELASEWSEKNEIKPTEVSIGSHKKVLWKCNLGHEWAATVKSRTINRTGCPYCSHNKVLAGFNDLATVLPEVAVEWSDRNENKPTEVTAFANSKAWWKCKTCDYEWNTLISTRSYGSKCPCCSGYVLVKGRNDLKTTHPNIAEEWSEQNFPLQPDEVNAKSRKNVWWHCKKCGNEWKSVINARVKGTVCPVCAERAVLSGYNDLATTDSDLLSEWDYELNNLKPTEVSRNSAKRAWWKCRYGHSWSMKIVERTVLGKGCRECEQEYRSLFPAFAISYYAKMKGLKIELGSDRLLGIPIDVYIPSEQVAIEVNLGSEKIETLKEHLCKQRDVMLSFVKEAIIMEKERQELLDLHCIATIDGYTDFIFINRFGNPQHQGTLNKAIRRIIRDCNDEQFLKNENPEVLLPHFSCHSLRHTFTTRMCEAGVNVKVIQDTLGHKDISTTLNIYTDVTKELRQSEFEGLDSYFKSEYNEVSNE